MNASVFATPPMKRRLRASWRFAPRCSLFFVGMVGILLAQASTQIVTGTETGDPVVGGELRVWHTVLIDFRGPASSEADDELNPFLDYRLQVEFTGPSGQQYDVPGFFNGDGLGNGEGNLWQVRFTPDELGDWDYKASFRTGKDVAISLDPSEGKPASIDGQGGSLKIGAINPDAPGFLKWGRLEYVGGHYLKFRNGPYWIRGGTDSPENFLAYVGFDNTPSSHKYAAHIEDWRPGDPDWNDGDGRAIIGVLNYFARKHVNSVYFLTMNIGGDGGDVYPWIGTPPRKGSPDDDNLHFDISKLSQWETVFEHAQRNGIFLHFVFNEAEEPNKRELDNGELRRERKLYYREMVARFGHHLAMQWNLCEEYNLGFNLGAERVRAFADYVRSVDPYDHPVTVHSSGDPVRELAFTFGDERFNMTSVQLNQRNIDDVTERMRAATIKAGRPIPISLDEFTIPKGQSSWQPVDDADRWRVEKIWPTYLSGGNIEFILGDLLWTESFKTPERDKLWDYLWNARKFVQDLPFHELQPSDALITGTEKKNGIKAQVFAKQGEVYAIYLPTAAQTGSVDLTKAEGAFQLQWYNPRNGRFEGSTVVIQGGTKFALADPPSDSESDWVVLIKKRTP